MMTEVRKFKGVNLDSSSRTLSPGTSTIATNLYLDNGELKRRPATQIITEKQSPDTIGLVAGFTTATQRRVVVVINSGIFLYSE